MKSSPPSRMPRTMDRAITTIVRFRVVSRSGQTTFLISAMVSRMKRLSPSVRSLDTTPRLDLRFGALALASRRASARDASVRAVSRGAASAVAADVGVTVTVSLLFGAIPVRDRLRRRLRSCADRLERRLTSAWCSALNVLAPFVDDDGTPCSLPCCDHGFNPHPARREGATRNCAAH